MFSFSYYPSPYVVSFPTQNIQNYKKINAFVLVDYGLMHSIFKISAWKKLLVFYHTRVALLSFLDLQPSCSVFQSFGSYARSNNISILRSACHQLLHILAFLVYSTRSGCDRPRDLRPQNRLSEGQMTNGLVQSLSAPSFPIRQRTRLVVVTEARAGLQEAVREVVYSRPARVVRATRLFDHLEGRLASLLLAISDLVLPVAEDGDGGVREGVVVGFAGHPLAAVPAVASLLQGRDGPVRRVFVEVLGMSASNRGPSASRPIESWGGLLITFTFCRRFIIIISITFTPGSPSFS